ncbi:MAG: SUMF1/EgtB/PvdO family nonheme iron enzyme, partial [Candidatus Competibacteraceae bacterium]|nr:SUMF1/EgtB/PvdO family nonheme iron enzyme [Candidatus Competibacteraceae bacterium]
MYTWPEVAAKCVLESAAWTPPDTRERLRTCWRPRLTDLDGDPEPEARAAVDRALGRLGLDDRPGVGLDENGLPDIDWVAIPDGVVIIEDHGEFQVRPFAIARHPVTQAQYQAFIDDGGYTDERWWAGLAEAVREPERPAFEYANHPRETVSWYEAMAFCRWLSDRLGFQVSLPTEAQWQQAAQGGDGREYPWGQGYRPGFANVGETWEKPHHLSMTSAVGIYPQGASLQKVLDLTGNVWEWCLNKYEDPGDVSPEGDLPR